MANNPFTRQYQLNPYDLMGTQDMVGEPEEKILQSFKEKANKCASREHMRIFCQSYLEKYHKSPLRIADQWQMEPTLLLSNSTTVSFFDLNNNTTYPAIREAEIKQTLLDDLLKRLLRDGFITYDFEDQMHMDNRKYVVRIRVAKVKRETK